MDVCDGLDMLKHKNAEDWVSRCRVAGAKSRGRSRKTWSECVKTDLRSLGMKKERAQDRVETFTWVGVGSSNTCRCGNKDIKLEVMMR